MPLIAMLFGGALIALGVTAYTSPELLGTGKAYQPTALFPAAFGAIFAVCGLISLVVPKARKHAMHGAAMFGVLGALGGGVPAALRSFDITQTAVLVGATMSVLSAAFVALCVNSFIAVRKARQRAAASQVV